jgi:hypothetical protein
MISQVHRSAAAGPRAWGGPAQDLRSKPGQAPRAPPEADCPRHRPPPRLTFADRLLATTLHLRLALRKVAIAALFAAQPEAISRRIRDIRQLLDQAGHTIQPGPHKLSSLDDLYRLATAESTVIPSEIKAAC